MQTLISNIQKFSVDDGPGIRTTVFFKGCNLKCAWCHNPECITFRPSLQFTQASCTVCGKCESLCSEGVHMITETGEHTVDFDKCTACGKCVAGCFARALSINGKNYTPEDLLTEIRKDRAFYKTSGGGVTFSGGEPMLHLAYLIEILKLCKQEGFHTAVDTAGSVPFEKFEKVLPYVDIFLLDIKAFSPDIHLEATAFSNDIIKENLKNLLEAGAKVVIRTPVIPEYNGNLTELDKIAEFLASSGKIEQIQLLPYHSYGAGKYTTMGMKNTIKDHTPPSDEFMEEALELFLKRGLNASIS